MLAGPGLEILAVLVLEGEVHHPGIPGDAGVDPGAVRAEIQLRARELSWQRRVDGVVHERHRLGTRGALLAVVGCIIRQEHERELPRLAYQVPDGRRIRRARHLHQDFVRSHGLDDRLGDARAIDALLHDRPDDVHLAGCRGDRVALGIDGVVLDLETALQVQAQLRLGRLPQSGVDIAQHGELGAGHEIDVEGERANDEDQDRD